MPYEVYNLDRIYLIRHKSFNNKGEKDNEKKKTFQWLNLL